MTTKFLRSTPLSLLILFLCHAGCKTSGGLSQVAGKDAGQSAKPPQVARAEGPIDRLDALLRAPGAAPSDVVDALVDHSGRAWVMQIEGFLDLYADQVDGQLDKSNKLATEFSDQLSHYTDTISFTKFARNSGAPPATVDYLAAQQATSKASFVKYLQDGGWLDRKGNPLDKMRNQVEGVAWPKEKKDRAYVVDHFKEALKEIKHTDYDLTDVEGGIHKFRRHVRWVVIEMTATNGLVRGEPALDPLPELNADISASVVGAKKYTVPSTDTKGLLPVKKYVQMSDNVLKVAVSLIETIGVVKDVGKGEEVLADALVKSGIYRDGDPAAKAKASELARTNPDFKDFFSSSGDAEVIQGRAQTIYDKFKKKIIPEMLLELKADVELAPVEAALDHFDDGTDAATDDPKNQQLTDEARALHEAKNSGASPEQLGSLHRDVVRLEGAKAAATGESDAPAAGDSLLARVPDPGAALATGNGAGATADFSTVTANDLANANVSAAATQTEALAASAQAQIDGLDQQVKSLDAQVTEAQSRGDDVRDLQRQVDDLKTKEEAIREKERARDKAAVP